MKVDVSIIFHILALVVPALLIISGMAVILNSDGSSVGSGVSSTLIVLGIFIYILEIVFYFGPSHREGS